MVELSDRSTLAVGTFENTAVFGPGETSQAAITSRDSSDIFLARFCPDGSLGWVRSAGGTGVDLGLKIAVLPDDDVLTLGVFEENAVFGGGQKNQTMLQAGGQTDLFMARYDREGNLKWAKRVGEATGQLTPASSPGATTLGLAVADDGSVLVAAGFRSTIRLAPEQPGEVLLTAKGELDMLLFRLGPAGDLVWAVQAGGDGETFAQGCCVLPDGTSFVTGGFSRTAKFGNPEQGNDEELTSAGNLDIFLARYEPDGSLGWARQAGGSTDHWDWGSEIACSADGGLYLVGDFAGDATFDAGGPNETTLSTPGTCDLFLARYDFDGSLQWARQFEGIARGYGLALSSDDTVVVAGKFFETITPGAGGPNATELQAIDEADIVIAKYGADGTLRWAKQAGGEGMEQPTDIAGAADGSSIVTGGFEKAAQFGQGEAGETWLRAAGQWDIFVMRLGP